jgi:hypothetical protein
MSWSISHGNSSSFLTHNFRQTNFMSSNCINRKKNHPQWIPCTCWFNCSAFWLSQGYIVGSTGNSITACNDYGKLNKQSATILSLLTVSKLFSSQSYYWFIITKIYLKSAKNKLPSRCRNRRPGTVHVRVYNKLGYNEKDVALESMINCEDPRSLPGTVL